MPSIDQSPTAEAVRYLRNLVSRHPVVKQSAEIDKDVTVINIESRTVHFPGQDQTTLTLDLSDGTTIRLDVQRYPTDPHDAAAIKR